jgi:hypothetical protein
MATPSIIMIGRSSGLPAPGSSSHPVYDGAVTFHPVSRLTGTLPGVRNLFRFGITAPAIVQRIFTVFPFHPLW